MSDPTLSFAAAVRAAIVALDSAAPQLERAMGSWLPGDGPILEGVRSDDLEAALVALRMHVSSSCGSDASTMSH